MIETYRAEVSRIRDENRGIAVSDVLDEIWDEAVALRPKVIVEIGTGVKGLRTRVLCYVAAMYGSDHVSVDVKDCRDCGNGWYPGWRFVQTDGRSFAKEWPRYAEENSIPGRIDLLVIDTDETYGTTKEIWEGWRRYLAPSCTIMFRCTNLRPRLVFKDGRSTMHGWDNHRGVVRVVEEIIGPINEMAKWSGRFAEWDVSHFPWGAGLTILRRIA